MDPAALILILLSTLVSCGESVAKSCTRIEVLGYGAVGDGVTNDTLAFMKSWKRICSSESEDASMVVSRGHTFLVHPITFSGPCKPRSIGFTLLGTIVAPESSGAWKGRDEGSWLIFKGVNGLKINGPGMIDGRGQSWWNISCRYHPKLPGCVKLAPTVLRIQECNHASVINISVINSPQTHILLTGCKKVTIASLNINSPGNSPNTDGIHISSCSRIFISTSNISSGDDCVSIGDHTSHIYITDVKCGPGHGVSIGSLGRSGNVVRVEDIAVVRTHFNKTTNGVRIKTWQVGRGHVRGVRYKNITFTDVQNPIVIDQYYCDVRYACKQTNTGVEISDVLYSGATGTSNTKIAINLNCSQAIPCKSILLDTIELAASIKGQQVISNCQNVYGSATRVLGLHPCLSYQNLETTH